MDVIDIHAHVIFKETLNSIKGLGPEIGGQGIIHIEPDHFDTAHA